MAQVYFHCSCSSAREVLIDRRGADVGDLVEARDRASRVVQLLIAEPGQEDRRNWLVHVSDDLGEEIFVVPFVSVFGKPH